MNRQLLSDIESKINSVRCVHDKDAPIVVYVGNKEYCSLLRLNGEYPNLITADDATESLSFKDHDLIIVHKESYLAVHFKL